MTQEKRQALQFLVSMSQDFINGLPQSVREVLAQAVRAAIAELEKP